MNSATDTIGFSNLEEAYTNLYEGYNTLKDALNQTRSDKNWANHYRKQAQNANVDSKAYAESGRLSNGQNIKGAKDFKIDADNYASSSYNFMNNSKNSSIQSCKKRNKSENSQHIANINKLNSDMDKQLAEYNRRKTELIRQKSDLYTNAIKDQVNLHKNTMEDYGTNVIANPSHALNLSFDDAVLQEIMTNTNEQISNIDTQYKDIEIEETNYKTNQTIQIDNANSRALDFEECFSNFSTNTRVTDEGYSNIEGFKEGLSFNLQSTSGLGNYDMFKKSVHNLIDNKIVEKAVQENNFKNDLVLSYLSDNDYSKTDLKKIYDSEEQKNNLNKRKNNILKYENNVFKQYIHILKVIVIVLLLIAPILILNKKEIINYTITKYLIIILFVLVFMYIIKILYDINSRDSINFNKYKLDDGKYRRLHEQGKISRKGRLSSMLGGTCIGSQCCDEGMTYDANSDKCIYTEISAYLKIISPIDSNTYNFTINSNKSGKLSVDNNGLPDTDILVGDNTLQISDYDSTKIYTATFTPDDGTDDGTDIVTIIIP
jgi:hypothetical protein